VKTIRGVGCPKFREHATMRRVLKRFPLSGKQSKKVNRQRQQRRFTREFKVAAIRLLESGAKRAAQLAFQLGVQCSQLTK
jgi:transposase-like protein